MSRPENAVFQVTEKLRVYWTTLEAYKASFDEGDREKFYAMVQECVELLLVKGVEQTWQTNWRKVDVWRHRDLDPGEAEKRIREQVRRRIQAARRLRGWEWWASSGIKEIGDNVDAWFGQATDPVKAAAVPKTPQTVEGRVVSVSSPRAQALRRRVAELESENGDLVEEKEELEAELATLRRAMQQLKKQLATSTFTVENQRQQIALLEKMTTSPKAMAPQASLRVPVDALLRDLSVRNILC